MLFDLSNQEIQQHITKAEFGIEREGLRVNRDGSLAQTNHPFKDNKYIDRDFCENQIEIISDVFTDLQQLNHQLISLQNEIDRELLKNGELLWPFSNPPRISGEDEIPVAQFVGSQRGKSEYRQYLAKKYGKVKMLFSGIHLNFSFSDELLRAAFELSGESDFVAFKNNLYLRLAKRLTQYAWLIVFLTAASPAADKSLGTESGRYSSVRCSERGYWNTFTPMLDYSSLQAYADSVQSYIKNGDLRAVSELYYPVRLKPRGANSLEELLAKGINHLELRVLDVNPLSRTGIIADDIKFVQLLMLYFSQLPDFDFDGEAQINTIANIKAAAIFGNAEIKKKAEKELEAIAGFAAKNFPEFSAVAARQQNKLKKGESYAEIISREFGAEYMKKGLALAESYQRGDWDV